MREARRLQALRRTSFREEREARTRSSVSRTTVEVEPGSYGEKLLQSGIVMPVELYLGVSFVISLSGGYLASLIGPIVGVFLTCAVLYYCLVMRLIEKAQKRKQRVVPQLPSFIDGLATALSTGFNIEMAVMQATQSVPPGILRDELDRVSNGISRGLSVEESFATLKHRVAGKEITALSIALTMFSGMGGRMLEPFKRMSQKMREEQRILEKASRDLVQVKQAFRILLVLSLVVPGSLFLLQPDYLLGAMHDVVGRVTVQVAVIMQILSVLAFKRMSSLQL